MCAVSAVSDYYQTTWPQRFPTNLQPWQDDPGLAQQLLDVVKRLEAIDKRLGDIECKDAEKERFLASLREAAKGPKKKRSTRKGA